MDVLFYTNWPLRSNAAGFRAHSGWWNQPERLQDLQRRLPAAPPRVVERESWTLPETLKFAWAANASAGAKKDDDLQPWLLTDVDVVFQCTADELRRRFPSFRTPLVVGTELKWFPQVSGRTQGDALDPFLAACRSPLRYPNSGGVIGTHRGLAALWAAARALPHFPCCSPWRPSAQCYVLGQACMQAALMKMHVANWPVCTQRNEEACDAIGSEKTSSTAWPPSQPRGIAGWRCVAPPGALRRRRRPIATTIEVDANMRDEDSHVRTTRHLNETRADYSLDTTARIFLNTYLMQPRDVTVNAKGQLVFSTYAGFQKVRRGEETVPCIVHTNGWKRIDLFRDLIKKWTAVTWVPASVTPLQRALLQQRKQTAKAAGG